jgi:hypothetical protein
MAWQFRAGILSALADQKAPQEPGIKHNLNVRCQLFTSYTISILKVAEKGAYPLENAACVLKSAGRIQPAGRSTPVTTGGADQSPPPRPLARCLLPFVNRSP